MAGEKKYSFIQAAAAAGIGFAAGFIMGAAVVAIIDYRDEKLRALKKLERDTDENYYYSTD
ncbi:MAG TPA: hypothetical protein DCZ71_06735 [Ruminococcus sp.]|nr:hypothetical protein [Ruminococcus sp.]